MQRLHAAHTHLNSSLHLTAHIQAIVAVAGIVIDAADDNQEQKWRTLTTAC